MTFKTLAIGLALAGTIPISGAAMADASSSPSDTGARLSAHGQDITLDAGHSPARAREAARERSHEARRRQAAATVHAATDRTERQLRQRRERRALATREGEAARR